MADVEHTDVDGRILRSLLLVILLLFSTCRQNARVPDSTQASSGTPGTLEDAADTGRIGGSRVLLNVGDNFQQLVDANPVGTHFVVASGIHRMQKVVPKKRMIFTGEPGAVMSGAKVLTSFTTEGKFWVSTGQTQQGHRHSCTYPCVTSGYQRDNYPEDLFIDGIRLRHVGSKSQVRSGTWFFDYRADNIYLGDDPSGKLVETSVTDHAFSGDASDVVIENLTVRHYATPTQTGAIHAADARNWTIRYVNASYNHATGVRIGPGARVHNSRMAYNGQLGIGGGTRDAAAIIEDNEISYNRQLNYNIGWEAGGLKTAVSRGTIVANNWVHHNNGKGIWFDVYNYDATIRSNLVEHNTHIGIFYEISYEGSKIFWNTVRQNGFGADSGADGAGIRVSSSRGVEVYENALDSNAGGILLINHKRESGPGGLLEIANVRVRNNDISMLVGTTGLIDETGNDAYYTSKSNVFDANTYRINNLTADWFSWKGRRSPHTWEEWRAFGNDRSGNLGNLDSNPSLPSEAEGFSTSPYGP